ncbi:hypothetical protein Tco_0274072, partial [Tanacetum coccineum]
MTASKSFNKHPKHKALYHALMESILMDEDAMDQGVADKQKKRKPADDDRDEDPPAGSDQGLEKRKTSKDAEPSKRSKSTGSFKGNTSSQPKQNQGDDMDTNNEQPNVEAALKKDWFKKPERPPTPDPEWNQGKSVDDEPTQNWLSDLAKARKHSLTFNELMSTPIDFTAFAMNRLQ